MTKREKPGITRRRFAKLTGAGAAAAGLGANFLFPARAAAQQKTLKILQWSHFVPAWDTWFNGTYVKEWGQKNNTNVIVDNINLVDLNARAASEASAKKGHDLFMLLSPPASYENQVIDMTNVYAEVEKKHGKKIDLAHKSTYNPKTKKYFAFSDAYTPDPGNWHKDWWTEAGYPNGPDTYDDLLKGGKKIRDATGHPVGLGLAQELDTSMALRAILWSFGGAEQDEAGNVTINSKQTVDALKYVKELYTQTETAEVFTWTPPSNNQGMLAGRLSFVQNAISVTRQSEREKLPIDSKIMISPALKGPVRRLAAEHVMNCYVIWKFARNVDGAKQFLVDLVGEFASVFRESEFYNFPCYPTTVPDIAAQLANDPKADPPGKYAVLSGVLDWATNIGYPGYATAAMDEVFNTYVLPTMFARVARGEQTPQQAVAVAQRELERIFAKWTPRA